MIGGASGLAGVELRPEDVCPFNSVKTVDARANSCPGTLDDFSFEGIGCGEVWFSQGAK